MFDKMSNPMFRCGFISRSYIYDQAAMTYQSGYSVMHKPDTIVESIEKKIHLAVLVRKQRYHINKMIPNRIFFTKVFGYSDLRYIFAVRKGGAIAHPDSYREVEQWTEK